MARQDRGERGSVRIDPRLLIGVVLVAGSTAGVWALVTGFDTTTEVYAVRDTVATGTRLDTDDLVVESVRLGGSAERYVVAGELPESGLVATRTIGAGELVPAAAVAERDDSALATVVVPSRGPLPSGLGPGSRVDVWSARLVEHGAYEPPAVLVAGAEVSGVVEPEGMVSGDGVSVELLVPREKVAAVLQALASGDAIDLVGARTGAVD
ncbi:hypothetical protein ABIQ69_11265 [Agromyces sp. G08B096]|uniref:SAF domain-containing protein n=1 Tax=Agromyces sp. G08B096 TaxID=3156399 RepID=A0AAU7W635_9MICO